MPKNNGKRRKAWRKDLADKRRKFWWAAEEREPRYLNTYLSTARGEWVREINSALDTHLLTRSPKPDVSPYNAHSANYI